MASQSSPILNITDPTIRQPPPGQIRPYPSPTSTGKIPFPIPSHPDVHAETWYAVHGTLAPPGDADADADAPVPLIVLHGGPGAAHNYLKPLALLSLGPRAPRPVVLYDQVGCGRSARLRARRGDDGLWRPQLFVDELDNLVRHLGLRRFDLLGQSWGGMLAAQYAAAAAAGPASGLRRLVICDSPADMATWVAVADGLRGLLPEGVQETLRRCEEAGETDGAEYEEAMLAFYKLFVCRVDPMPKEFVETLELLKEDDTVYYTMNGPSEFHVIGNLKTWDIKPELHKIQVPTLLINGKFDEAQDAVMRPFFTGIKSPVKWVRFAESSHMPQLEETEDFIRTVEEFLTEEL